MDFVETFMDYTSQGVPSPEIFRLWGAITAVAGALERRVWIRAYAMPTYANLYVALVASPGIGKGVIEEVAQLWGRTKKLHLSPDSVTAASMLDALIEAKRAITINGKLAYEYHTLLVPAEELAVLLPKHDLEFLGRLNYIFNNPAALRVKRKYLDAEVNIPCPQMTILTGAQPGLLASMLPDEAWEMGFTQRLIMVYSGSTSHTSLFEDTVDRGPTGDRLIAHLRMLCDIHGEMVWDEDASVLIKEWHDKKGPPRPTHTRLVHYLNRRTQYVLKLTMISAMSRGAELHIRHADVIRALDWLLEAEKVMPDVFREMVQKSDHHVLQELHYFAWRLWSRGHKPIHRALLMRFLSSRVPSEKCGRVLEVAEQVNLLTRNAGTEMYVPVARDSTEIE